MSKDHWQLDNDPLKSAKAYLKDRGQTHNVSLMDLPSVKGTEVVAFQVDDFMRAWATKTQELAMDSTCKLSAPFLHGFLTT